MTNVQIGDSVKVQGKTGVVTGFRGEFAGHREVYVEYTDLVLGSATETHTARGLFLECDLSVQ